MNNVHISSLSISRYRGIKNLILSDFPGISIFAGNNNSGKTSVLELLRVLENPLRLRAWAANGRTGSRVRNISWYEALSDFFPITEEKPYIEYSAADMAGNTHKISVQVEYKTLQKSMNAVRRDAGMVMFRRNSESDDIDREIDVSQLFFQIQCDDSKAEYKVSEYARMLPPDLNEDFFIFKPINYISPTKHADSVVYLNEILNNPQLYDEMLSVLQDFDSDILSINVAQRSEFAAFSRPYYTILSRNMNKALPLNMYGDGMKKAILLMSAVVASKDGILLIDEFETAIHTSAMKDVFQWIIKTCKKLNVQLFLTSHSIEAIKMVLSMDDIFPNDIALYTLYHENGESSVRRLSAKDALEASDSFGLELR